MVKKLKKLFLFWGKWSNLQFCLLYEAWKISLYLNRCDVVFIQCVFVASFVLTTAMQVAVRKPSKGTYVTLWMHEHFAVYKNKSKPKGKRELDIYQRLFLPAFESLFDCLGGFLCLPFLSLSVPSYESFFACLRVLSCLPVSILMPPFEFFFACFWVFLCLPVSFSKPTF